MAFRNFQVNFVHALRHHGIGAVSSVFAVDADFPLDYLIDDSATRTMRFDASLTGHKIDLDRGADFATAPTFSRMIVPAGNNLTSNAKFRDDSVPTFDSPPAELGQIAMTQDLGDQVDITFTQPTQRYVRVIFQGTGLWHIPELIYTEARTFTRGADLDDMGDTFIHKTIRIEHQSGAVSVVVRGPRHRLMAAKWHNLSSTDLDILSDLIDEVGTSRPFYIDPPSFSSPAGDDEPARWVKLPEDIVKEWATSIPGKGVKQQSIEMAFEDHLA